MKYFFVSILFITLLSSCEYNKRIKGNGIVKSIESAIKPTSKLKLKGSINVLVSQGDVAGISIQADENILPYIIVEKDEDGYTVVKTKSGYNISTNNVIQVNYTSPIIESLSIIGSGDIISNDKILNDTKIKISIVGSGDVNMSVNAPIVETNISGSGNIKLLGEVRDLNVNISGDGDFKGEELLGENATIKISGSGNVRVYADAKLDIKISGSGDVFYKGKCIVTQKISGSGNIKPIE